MARGREAHLVFLGVAVVLLFAPPAAGQEQQAERGQRRASGFVFGNRPSLRYGNNMFRMDFRLKVQNDVRGFSPHLITEDGTFEMNRFRAGVQGRLLRHFEYEFEYELRDEMSRLLRIQREEAEVPLRDAFLNFRYFDDFQIQLGKFKIPFGMEQLTGPTNLDFVFRSRISDQLAPARDLGVVLHGRFFRRGLGYEAGLFRHDGENAFFRQVVDDVGTEKRFKSGLRTFVGRVTGAPMRLLPVPGYVKGLELGGGFVSTTVPEGLKSLRGRTSFGETFFDRMFVHGRRLRLGAELRWASGPFSIKSEFMHVQEERRNQSILGTDLPDLVSRGWYVSGTWVLTGQNHAERDEPKKAFLYGRGIGAVELAGRYEQLRFGSAEHIGNPSRSLRASNVLPNSDRVWTLGINWYLNRWTKIQVNGIRERIEDIQRTPLAGETTFWMRIVRFQFVM